MKTFDISALSEGKKSVQYVQVFSKGKKYMLNMCGKEGMPEGLTLSLYNSKRKLLGTNVINGKHQTKVTFPCSATGLYYLVYTLSENTSEAVQMDCGKSVLSLKFEEKD
ncbi:MAG: hypothetical protein MI784_13035 [Cytophagales bacterium]|nr:hypothetical protein [Cytophagales bacterium]